MQAACAPAWRAAWPCRARAQHVQRAQLTWRLPGTKRKLRNWKGTQSIQLERTMGKRSCATGGRPGGQQVGTEGHHAR